MRHVTLSALLLAAACHSTAKPGTPAAAAQSARTEAECRACNGDWGAHGLHAAQTGEASCVCRARDAGKRCKDGRACEGDCLLEEGQTEVVDPGPPARGYFLGKCSEFAVVWGCHQPIPDGAASTPTRLDQPPDSICVD